MQEASKIRPDGARRRIATVKVAASEYPEYCNSEGAWRALIFNAEARKNSRGDVIPGNGLAEYGVIIRRGRKVMLDLDAYDLWLDAQKSC